MREDHDVLYMGTRASNDIDKSGQKKNLQRSILLKMTKITNIRLLKTVCYCQKLADIGVGEGSSISKVNLLYEKIIKYSLKLIGHFHFYEMSRRRTSTETEK